MTLCVKIHALYFLYSILFCSNMTFFFFFSALRHVREEKRILSSFLVLYFYLFYFIQPYTFQNLDSIFTEDIYMYLSHAISFVLFYLFIHFTCNLVPYALFFNIFHFLFFTLTSLHAFSFI